MKERQWFDKYCKSEYRQDIQGFRALSAIIIMVFHIWLNKVSGGVDAFFVISGFLMSSLLLRDFFKNGVVSPIPFWGGVIKRVFPSAYLVLGVTLLGAFFLFPPSLLSSAVEELIASSLNIENIQLMRKSVSYLGAGQPASPTQQFWALSLQIQFYAALPFLLLPLAYVSKKRKSSRPLLYGFILAFFISFAYSIHLTYSNADLSYFNPLTRAWEFFLGAIIYLLISDFSSIKNRDFLGFLGLALFLGGAFFIPKGAKFPGAISLVPVSGAAFVIVSGFNGKGVLNKILSNKVMVFLGGISFTIYLWHWPILVFYKRIFDKGEVGVLQGVAVILLSIILAIATSKIVESPFRKISRGKVFLNLLVGVVFFVPVLVSALMVKNDIESIAYKYGMKWIHEDIISYTEDSIYLGDGPIGIDREELIAARKILPVPHTNSCQQNPYEAEIKECRFGKLGSDKKIILAGSSHAVQWLPALKSIAKDNKMEVINMTKDGCSLGAVEGNDDSCYEWNERLLSKILEIKPDAVVTNSTNTGGYEEYVPESYVDRWSILSSKNIKVVGIRDNPRFGKNVPDCLYKNRFSNNPIACSVDRNDVLKDENPAEEYSDVIENIDMSEFLCVKEKCIANFNGYIMYRDSNHIHLPYVRFLKGKIEEKLKNSVPEIF
ncbi:MAG: acyltransferase [Atopostipes suicloacalis]|nr:acyltransferase [Atopostipes suicloacalis]